MQENMITSTHSLPSFANQFDYICIIDSEAFIDKQNVLTSFRELCLLIITPNESFENNIKTCSQVYTIDNFKLNITKSNSSLIESTEKRLNKLLSHNTLFVGFNTAYDLKCLNHFKSLKNCNLQYIDISDAFRKKYLTNCLDLEQCSALFREHMNMPMWKRQQPHSAKQDCIETLHCMNFIYADFLDVSYTTVSEIFTINDEMLSMVCQSLVDYALPVDSCGNLTTLNNKREKLLLMLKYIYYAMRNKHKIKSLAELVNLDKESNFSINYREYGIPLSYLYKLHNKKQVLFGCQLEMLKYLASQILTWKNNETENQQYKILLDTSEMQQTQQYRFLFDTPEKKEKLRTNIFKQEETIYDDALNWKNNYSEFQNKQLKLAGELLHAK